MIERTEKDLVVRSDGSDGRPKGAFVPGHPAGFRRGSVNKLTKAMRLAAIEEMERGGDRANPLLVLLRVMQDPEADLKLKADCADKLAKHLWGVKNSFEIETPTRLTRIGSPKRGECSPSCSRRRRIRMLDSRSLPSAWPAALREATQAARGIRDNVILKTLIEGMQIEKSTGSLGGFSEHVAIEYVRRHLARRACADTGNKTTPPAQPSCSPWLTARDGKLRP